MHARGRPAWHHKETDLCIQQCYEKTGAVMETVSMLVGGYYGYGLIVQLRSTEEGSNLQMQKPRRREAASTWGHVKSVGTRSRVPVDFNGGAVG